MLGDRDLREFRLGYYTLLVSLLWRDPPASTVAGLLAGADERTAAAAAVDPVLGEGWAAIAEYVRTVPPADLGDRLVEEYTHLFVGPPAPRINLYESYYLVGRVMDRPLADVRGSLAALGIARDPDYAEPEDFLAFELEVMRRLVDRQGSAPDPRAEAQAVEGQASFLTRHLLVWAPAAARDLAGAAGAPFYRGVGLLLQGFLAFEREVASGWGGEPIQSMDDARGRYAGSGLWRGPVLDLPGSAS